MPAIIAASGNLGYLALRHAHERGAAAGVMTDGGSEGIAEFARAADLPLYLGNPRKREAGEFVENTGTRQLLSVNYLFLFDEHVIDRLRVGINIHGSLLPKYRGRTPHVWAIINNEKECGVTAHLISKDCDAGNILHQVRIPILDEDTGGSILKKFTEVYPGVIDVVLDKLRSGDCAGIPQDEKLATHFGKREPKDGRIVWSWQRERIRNWIRAQTKPYPGAFAYTGDAKLVVWEASPSDSGFRQTDADGTILKIEGKSLIVKTPNGCLELPDWELEGAAPELREGQVLR